MRTTEATVAATMIRRKDILAAVTSTKKKKNTLAAATKTRRKVIPAAAMSTQKKRNTLAAAIITKKYKQTQKKSQFYHSIVGLAYCLQSSLSSSIQALV